MGLSQKQLAEILHIDARTLSRIESGSRDLHLWEFVSFMQLMGMPTDDWWVLHLDSQEYSDYMIYREARKLFRMNKVEEGMKLLAELEESPAHKHPFVLQYITCSKIFFDEEISDEEALKILFEALRMTREEFDENNISEYRLTHSEVSLLIAVASRLDNMGQMDRAIKIYQAMIDRRKDTHISAENKAALFPVLLFNLSTLLGKSGRLREAIKCANDAWETSIEYNNLYQIPQILYNIAKCYYLLGEEERVYVAYFIRAYHNAYAIGNNKWGAFIKKYAEEIGISNYLINHSGGNTGGPHDDLIISTGTSEGSSTG